MGGDRGMTVTRIGAVGYLNTRPLVYGLEADPRVSLRFDVPATCAALLHAGEVDVAMIPSIEYLRGDYRIVPGIAIASLGPAASVAVFTKVPVGRIRRVALDTSSRTSVALLKVLCAERFGIAPAFEPHGPALADMLRAADAALLIGDPCLYADFAALGVQKVDLGEEWLAHTGLPFVFAFWATSAAGLEPSMSRRLLEARDRGVLALDEIARHYCPGDPGRARISLEYLRHNMKYDLAGQHVQALKRFYASAAAIGVVPAVREPLFLEDAEGTAQGAWSCAPEHHQ
jgi:chorismate dehydratase